MSPEHLAVPRGCAQGGGACRKGTMTSLGEPEEQSGDNVSNTVSTNSPEL